MEYYVFETHHDVHKGCNIQQPAENTRMTIVLAQD